MRRMSGLRLTVFGGERGNGRFARAGVDAVVLVLVVGGGVEYAGLGVWGRLDGLRTDRGCARGRTSIEACGFVVRPRAVVVLVATVAVAAEGTGNSSVTERDSEMVVFALLDVVVLEDAGVGVSGGVSFRRRNGRKRRVG